MCIWRKGCEVHLSNECHFLREYLNGWNNKKTRLQRAIISLRAAKLMGRVLCLYVFSENGILSADTLSEDEDEPEVSEAVSVRANLFGRTNGYSPSPGGPFSALIPSMWPLDLLASLAQVSQGIVTFVNCYCCSIHSFRN